MDTRKASLSRKFLGRTKPRLRPRVATRAGFEEFERRQLMASGLLQGTAFADLNSNGLLDAGEALAGVTIELTKPSDTSFAKQTTTTDANGNYAFGSLATGDYRLTEVAPAGKTPSATQAIATVNTVLSKTTSTIDVHVIDPSATPPLTLDYYQRPADKAPIDYIYNGTLHLSYVGQFDVKVVGGPQFTTFCVDPAHDVTLNVPFNAATGQIDTAINPNGGRIAYIFNHYGSTAVSGTEAAAIQLAIWELEFDPGDPVPYTTSVFTTGAIQVPPNVKGTSGYDSGALDSVALAPIEARAVALMNESIGKSEKAYLLDASFGGTVNPHSQNMIAGGSYNFGNRALAPASIAGNVYVDANTNGVLDAGDAGLGGVSVTLSGTNDLGPITPVTISTNPDGSYSFGSLRPGTYTVTEAPTPLYGEGTNAPGTPSNGTVAGDVISHITVSEGANLVGYNFGEVTGSLSGTVYFDAALSGVAAGQPGLGGVTVTLKDSLGNTVATTTTATNGTYAFTGLLAGAYTVVETQPAGYNEGTDTAGTAGGNVSVIDVISGINQPGGAASTGYNFGEVGSSISGTVFIDANKDGIDNNNEAGLGGVTVTLQDSGGNTVATTTTNPNGSYAFTNLPPGSYTVVESKPAAYGTSTVTSHAVTLGAAPVTGEDFGLTTGSIAGVVYFDAALSGVATGQPGIGGATVTLQDSLGNTVATTTTATNGTYSFAGLLAGTYTVVETQPAGYNEGTDTAGTAGGNVSVIDVISSVNQPAGTDSTGYNFGEIGSSIAGTVFIDANKDGIDNNNEAGLGGVTVTLQDSGGNTIATTTTATNGTYAFTNLPPGSYTVVESKPAAYGTSTPTSIPVTLGAAPLTGENFGLTTGSIAGVVYFDAALSGVATGQPGIGGVTVTLKDSLGNTVATTATANDGSYSFTGLLAGIYTVVETQPAGYNEGTDTAGTAGGNVSVIDVISAVNQPAGVASTGYNFGEVGSSIAGTVFIDANKDGIDNNNDAGLGGVTVTLQDSGGNTIATTITKTDGTYAFTNLPPGSYTVVESKPAAYGTSTVTSHAVTLGAAPVTGEDFGLTTGSIAGVVYFDAALSGVAAGQPGLGGVTVTLQDSGGNTVAATTTKPDGSYAFTGLLAGTYTVVETQPAGYNEGTDTAGTAGGSVSVIDVISSVNQPAGTDSTGYNFGEVGSSISGTVFIDANKDGIDNNNDAGLGGVTVTLQDSGGNTIATTTTNPNGSYTFTNLPPGSYTVVESKPGAYGTSTPVTIPVTLGAAALTGENFGLTTGSLSGFVYADANNDGIKQNTETGLGGVTVTLSGKDVNGNTVLATAVTNADGSYSFTGLLAGTYAVGAGPAAGYLTGITTPGTISNSPTPTVPVGVNDATSHLSGIVLAGGNTAINDNFGEIRGASVSGYVYIDSNTNGVRNTGEAGLGGVTVTLSGTNDLGAITPISVQTNADGSYSFTNLRPGTYVLTETQPNGYTTTANAVGTVGGVTDGALDTVLADVIKGIVLPSGSAGVEYDFGEIQPGPIAANDTATIGFWANHGQGLITSLNGGPNATNLATWLTSNFGNLFPASKIGTTNASVAAYFVSIKNNPVANIKLEAQVMAVALAAYVTDSSLAGNAAAAYGFHVSAGGTGSKTFNVGSNGTYLGLANNTSYTILALLRAANAKATNGTLFVGNANARSGANTIFSAINQTGDIQ